MGGTLNALVGSFAPVRGAFESIASVTASGGETLLSFSSIPSTYKHLQIRTLIRNVRALNTVGGCEIYFNGENSGSNYNSHVLSSAGSTGSVIGNNATYSLRGVGWLSIPFASTTANAFGVGIVDIHDYASTSKNKTVKAFSGAEVTTGVGSCGLFSGLWTSTSAINSISFFTGGGGNEFAAGSTFALYGIKGE
jgi:hypothetical protein